MHVETTGPATGPALLFVHGGGVAGWMWRAQVERFSREFRVVVPDLPGHGRSASIPYTSAAEVADDLARLLEDHSATNATVVGFSHGAQLAVQLASTRPDLVGRACVVSAQTKPLPLTGLTLWLLGAMAPLARNRRFATLQAKELLLPESMLADYLEVSATVSKRDLVALTAANLRFEVPAAWSRYPGSALILAGDKERAVMRDSAAVLHAQLPTSELELVPGTGHGIPLQRPDWFNDRLEHWIGSHGPS